MTVTKDTRLAWAIARDDGMRSQHEIIVARLETGCEVQVGNKGGIGAGVNADYAHVLTCIESLPAPERHVGDALNCRGVLSGSSMRKASSLAALAVAQIAVKRLPGYTRWSSERQQKLYWVALAALERQWVVLHGIAEKTDHKGREEGCTLDEPWKIGKWLRGRHNQSLDLKNWGKQWANAWEVLQAVIQELDFSGMDYLNSRCYIREKWKKAS